MIIKNEFLVCFLVFLLTTVQLQAKQYNNFEGQTESVHLQELQQKIEKYITTQGQIDITKLNQTINYFSQKRSSYENTLFLNEESRQIDDQLQDWKTAEKKALKLIKEDREGLIAFDEVIRRSKDLIENKNIYSDEQIKMKIGTLALYIAVTDTILHEHFQYDLVNMLVTLGRNFFRVSKKANQVEASNLLLNDRFLSQKEIHSLEAQGFDLSKLNPPQSAFWTDNKVEDYNPDSVEWYGEKLFPSLNEPQDFYFNRIGEGTVKIKAHWKDQLPNGKEKKKSITLRLGIEIHSGTLASHLIRSLGFYAIPSTYRQQVRLFLGDLTYEEFLNSFNHLQGETMYDLSSFITSYNKKENYVVLKGVCLESYPDDDRYQKLGPFRTGRNGFDNRREYRSWLMNGALISLNDTQDKQTRVDVIRKDKKSEWEPIFMVSDLGYSMGSYLLFDNLGAVNDYSETMTSKIGQSVMIWWANGFDGWENYQHATASDIRWWLRRAKRLKPDQIYRMAINSGFPVPVARLYTIKIQKRINDFIRSFEMENELGLYQPESYSSVHLAYPRYVTEKGNVTNAIEEIRTSNASFIGPFTTLSEILTVHAQNLLQKQIEKPFTFELGKTSVETNYDFGENRLSYNIKMGRKRTIKQNENKSESQKRFQVKDIYEISIPVGLVGLDIAGKEQRLQTPASFSFHYRYTYIHSYDDPLKAGQSRFFKSFMPWNLQDLKKQLKTGESLLIETTSGYEIGTLKAESENFIQFEFAPLQWSKNKTNQILITKTQNNLELTTSYTKANQVGSHFNLSAGLKFHIGYNAGNIDRNYKIFRIDLNELNTNERSRLTEAFNKAVILNDYDILEKTCQNYEIISEEKFKNSHFGLFVWDRTSNRQVKQMEFNLTDSPLNSDQARYQPGKKNTHQLFIARQVNTSDRSFGNFWIKNFDFGQADFIFDLMGDGINNGVALMSELQLAANKEMTDIDQLELNLEIRKYNKFITKELFVKNYLNFFSQLSGAKQLFNYQFAEGVLFVSPTEAMQTWQINQIAIQKILTKLENSEDICTSPCQDRIDKLQYFKSQLKKAGLTIDAKKKIFSRIVDLTQKQISLFIGSQFQRLNQVINLVGEENIWLRTRISNIHRTDIPISRNKYDSIYSQPIGKYQGDSRLKEIKKKYYFAPMMDYETVQFDEDSQMAVGSK